MNLGLEGEYVAGNAGYVVVDLWRAKPGTQQELDRVLESAARRFREHDGIVSVDYARLEDNPDVYLAVFRYLDKEARDRFAETDDLKATMAELRQLWDLESPIYKGISTGY